MTDHGATIEDRHGSIDMGSTFNGLAGLILLGFDLWALVNVLGSGVQGWKKGLWSLWIVGAPVIGVIVWGIAGPRWRRRPGPTW
jgi:hypothetical protein